MATWKEFFEIKVKYRCIPSGIGRNKIQFHQHRLHYSGSCFLYSHQYWSHIYLLQILWGSDICNEEFIEIQFLKSINPKLTTTPSTIALPVKLLRLPDSSEKKENQNSQKRQLSYVLPLVKPITFLSFFLLF